MRFRPCIDIHNGAVKQIVGGSLKTYLHIIQELESKDIDIIMRSLANLN